MIAVSSSSRRTRRGAIREAGGLLDRAVDGRQRVVVQPIGLEPLPLQPGEQIFERLFCHRTINDPPCFLLDQISGLLRVVPDQPLGDARRLVAVLAFDGDLPGDLDAAADLLDRGTV